MAEQRLHLPKDLLLALEVDRWRRGRGSAVTEEQDARDQKGGWLHRDSGLPDKRCIRSTSGRG